MIELGLKGLLSNETNESECLKFDEKLKNS